MKTAILAVWCGSLLGVSPALASEPVAPAKAALREGQVEVQISENGKIRQKISYAFNARHLRIDEAKRGPTARPYNLIDTGTSELTVVFPHNGTYSRLPVAAKPGVRRPASPEQAPRKLPKPIAPPLPRLPTNFGPSPGSAPGMPELPPPPALPSIPNLHPSEPPSSLKDTGETREIHGYPCKLFTIDGGDSGKLIIWATSAIEVPFHTLTTRTRKRAADESLLASWPAVVRAQMKFPLLVTRAKEGKGNYRFEVISIGQKPIDVTVFKVPEEFEDTRSR